MCFAKIKFRVKGRHCYKLNFYNLKTNKVATLKEQKSEKETDAKEKER